MVYKTIGVTALGVLSVLVVSAALENRNATATNGFLNGSFGAGEWYETQYVDVALLIVFGALFALTRRHKGGKSYIHLFMGAAFATSIALIISKWITQYRDLNPTGAVGFNQARVMGNRYGGVMPPYVQQNAYPVSGASPSCGCGA